MCTVTIFSKGKNDFVLTSNRDEAPNRVSIAPEEYDINGTRLMFPKDELAGGTWIGVSDKKRLVCVLNGAFEPHRRLLNYRQSRGVVAKDFLISEDIHQTVYVYNLVAIEPFTMIIVDWNKHLKFYELIWDGDKKHFSDLPLEPKIWSSSSLYSLEMKQERNKWFSNFKLKESLNAKTLMQFHKNAGKGNAHYGVIMNREFVKTTSITQVEKNGDMIEMIHENLQSSKITQNQFMLS